MSESVEMYLKTLYELSNHREIVAISAVARRLGVSSVSAAEMIKRLEERGAVIHIPYKGVELTPEGARRALSVLRRHRLWEVFLFEKLGLPWETTHTIACDIEHVSSDNVTDALETFLGSPTRCPHGNPIPDNNGNTDNRETVPLVDLNIGQSGVITSVYPEETTMLIYLEKHGIRPGKKLNLMDIAPYSGSFKIRIDGTEQTIDRAVTAFIQIIPD